MVAMTTTELRARCERAQRLLFVLHGRMQVVAELGRNDLTPEATVACLKELAGPENGFDALQADDVLQNAARVLDTLVGDLVEVVRAGAVGQAIWNGVRCGAYTAAGFPAAGGFPGFEASGERMAA